MQIEIYNLYIFKKDQCLVLTADLQAKVMNRTIRLPTHNSSFYHTGWQQK
jgi:hypothetical protein